MKGKAELTAEAVLKVIDEKKLSSLTRLAHEYGYKGSVSGSLAKKFRALIPNIDELLKGTANSGGQPEGDSKGNVVKALKGGKVVKAMAKKPDEKRAVKPIAKVGKWPHDERSPFREGSSYDTCISIMIGHPAGLPRERLVELLSKATGKDLKKAAFDEQVVCSARGAAGEGLNPFAGPRNRSARFGYWIKREGDNVRLMLPTVTTKEWP